MENIENFEKWNEDMAIKYNPNNYHNSKNFLIRWIERSRSRRIIEMINVAENDNVLDLGCGAGNMLAQLNGGKLYGLDISDFLLGIAAKRKYSRPVTFVKGNVECFPSEIVSKKFDKIFCSEVLEHVLHPEKVVDEILKVGHFKTVIVFSVPNEKLINKVKSIFLKLKIFDFFFPNISKHMTDEWHLREADKIFLMSISNGKLVCEEIIGAPFNFFPLHFVARYSIK